MSRASRDHKLISIFGVCDPQTSTNPVVENVPPVFITSLNFLFIVVLPSSFPRFEFAFRNYSLITNCWTRRCVVNTYAGFIISVWTFSNVSLEMSFVYDGISTFADRSNP